MRTFILLIFLQALPFLSAAQVLKGKITDTSGAAIPDATLYIRELAQGITADNNGEFRTTLKEGAYTCDFSSLGYERKSVPVSVKGPITDLMVRMDKKVYELKEVIISSKREDPAYAIMRKAISMAPFYLNQIKKYESEVYLKGTVKIEKLPAIVKISANSKELKNITNKLFLIESQNEVTFTAPGKYDQKVIAFSSTVPADIDANQALEVMTTNIYDPKALDRISPLAPGAFTYYKFTFEGITTEGEHLVNKIRVQPKKNNPKLVNGWLYIIENSWNVQSADLSATEMGITIRFKAMYNEVKPYAFLPTSYDIDMKINLMGIKASGKYYSSVQYKLVDLNETQGVLQKKQTPQTRVTPQTPKPQTPKQQKAQQQLEVLMAKEDLSNREAYKMARLIQETSEPEEKKKKRQSLEIKPDDSDVKISVDSLAHTRDSLYWEAVRDLPLRQEEIVSYQKKDSLKMEMDSLQSQDSIRNRTAGYWIGKIVTGEDISFGKKYTLGYSGLLRACPLYNFVDGFWLGQKFTFKARLAKGRILTLTPSAYFATARKKVNWQIDGDYEYIPVRGGRLSISGGHTTADYNNENGMLQLINSFSSLIFGKNPIKFYEKKFITVSNTIDLANGLPLTTGLRYEKRNALDNRQSYNFFGNTPSSNLPHGQTIQMPENTAFVASLRLSYTPRYRYRMYKGKKEYADSDYPTFSLRYDRGIPVGGGLSSSFDRLEGSITQTVKIDEFNRFIYNVNAGKFLSTKRLYLPDFKHFETNEIFISGSSLMNSFSLLDNYASSTGRQWLQAHADYNSAYLLLKRLPFLQSYMFEETLHARTLWLPGRNYTEFGYSVGLPFIGGIGVFVGLDKGRYDAIGFTISIPVLKSMGVK